VPVVAGGAAAEEAHGDGHGIHLPSPSFMPLIAAFGLPIIGFGFIYDYALVAAGALITLFGIYAWALEPVSE
jgi:cytochrome c oxidase subunit 1